MVGCWITKKVRGVLAFMCDKFSKLKKLLGICVVILLLVAFGRSFAAEPLAHKILPSTIHVDEIEWDSCTQIGENTWDYTYKLPNLISADDIVSIATYWVSVDIYVDDSQLLKYSDINMERGSCRQWIRLPLWAAGRTLHVVYSGEKKQVETSAQEDTYIGNAALVYLTFIKEKAYALVFAACVCLMLVLIIYFYRLMSRQLDGSMKRGLWYLGLFMLTTGIWIVCDSHILFIVTRNAAGNMIAAYSALILFPMFLIMFVSEMAEHRIKALDILPVFYMIDFIFMIGGHLIHLISLNHSLITLHILIVISIFVLLIGGIRDVRKKHNKDMKKILAGFVGLACCGVVALVQFNISRISNYSVLYCLGLLIFIFFVVWAAYERLYRLMGHNAKVMAYRRLAYKDSLTNLGNRAAFMKEQQELSPEASVGFVVMDINNLKHTNDCFGHQAGDELICSAADCILQVFKDKGNVYRIGGDEFVVIVSDATEEYLKQLLRRLEEAQAEKQKELGKPWKLQIAYGYAVHCEGLGYEELFRQADDRMYECKRRMKEMEQSEASEKM